MGADLSDATKTQLEAMRSRRSEERQAFRKRERRVTWTVGIALAVGIAAASWFLGGIQAQPVDEDGSTPQDQWVQAGVVVGALAGWLGGVWAGASAGRRADAAKKELDRINGELALRRKRERLAAQKAELEARSERAIAAIRRDDLPTEWFTWEASIKDPHIRRAVFDMLGGHCAKCKVELEKIGGFPNSLHVDHIIPQAGGGADAMWNYQPLCATCNMSKGASIADYRPRPFPA